MALTANAEKSTTRQCVLACPDTSEVLLLADLNASSALSVLSARLVSIRNVSILVLEPAALALNVLSSTTTRSAAVLLGIQETRSPDARLYVRLLSYIVYSFYIFYFR